MNCITALNGFAGLRLDTTYINDSRLIDPMRGRFYDLNRPPLTGRVRENEVYDHHANWQNYKNYQDIKRGQISYYYRGDTRPPYEKEIFNSGDYSVIGFINPIGAKSFYYPFNDCTKLCNQYMNDTQFQREDIMQSQMTPITKHKYVVL